MFFKLGISLVCLLVSLGNACDSKSGAGQHPAPEGNASQTASTAQPTESKSEAKSEAGPASSAVAFDACALIEKSEIASVQGVEVQQMQPTSQKTALDISQCYYKAIPPTGRESSVFQSYSSPEKARREA